jgi:hypothetical protein
MRRWLLLALFVAVSSLAGPASSQAASNAAYVGKALTVGQSYWKARRPASSCEGRPVSIEYPARIDALGFALIGICELDYDPTDPTQASLYAIKISSRARKAGWLTFCTTVLQEWGWMAGQLASKNPKSVMYPVIGPRNYQRKACGHAPG